MIYRSTVNAVTARLTVGEQAKRSKLACIRPHVQPHRTLHHCTLTKPEQTGSYEKPVPAGSTFPRALLSIMEKETEAQTGDVQQT